MSVRLVPGFVAALLCGGAASAAPVAPANIAPALAQAAPSAWTEAMARGRAAYDAFALEQAESAFLSASSIDGIGPREQAVTLLWLGMLRAENGDFDGAAAHFQDACELDLQVAAPDTASPRIKALLQEARQQAVDRRKVAGPPEALPGAALKDTPLAAKPRWLLMSGGAVAAIGVLAVGTGAMAGMVAQTQRDVAQTQAFQQDAVNEYRKAVEGAYWANIFYGAGSLLVASGTGLALASVLGADQ
jgi:tetratricopeptide (TPR) repeat protein